MLALQRATNDYSKQFFARVELSAASSLLRVGEWYSQYARNSVPVQSKVRVCVFGSSIITWTPQWKKLGISSIPRGTQYIKTKFFIVHLKKKNQNVLVSWTFLFRN